MCGIERVKAMYCRNCGEEIDEKAVICPHCKTPTGIEMPKGDYKEITPLWVWFVVSLFLPFLGTVLWIVWKDDHKPRSRPCGIGSLIGWALYAATLLTLLIVLLA